MKQSLKSGIPEFDEAVEQFENGEINFVELTSRLWNKAYKIGKAEQCNIANVVDRLPEDTVIRDNAREMDEKEFEHWWKEFEHWWWETVYKGN